MIRLRLVVQCNLVAVRFSSEVEKDEMPPLPEGGIVDELLEVNELQVVDIQAGLLFGLADSGFFDALT